MSAGDIDDLCELWAASKSKCRCANGNAPPFIHHRDVYKTIDQIDTCDVAWSSFTVTYQGPCRTDEPPSWMVKEYDVWYRNPHEVIKNMLANTGFNGEMDSTPYRVYGTDGGREYQHFMSGDWAWDQAV
jgi:hypothetical protein